MENESTFAGTLKMEEWLPDGKNVDEYPSPETATSSEWAWECLRRNLDYQKAYCELSAFEKKYSIQNLIKDVRSNIKEVEKEGLELVVQYSEQRRQLEKEFKIWILDEKKGAPDPSLGFDQAFLMERQQGWAVCIDEGNTHIRKYSFAKEQIPALTDRMERNQYKENKETETIFTTEPMKLVVEIDLRSNLVSQMDVIRTYSRAIQKKLKDWGLVKEVRGKPDKEHMLNRLRAHDMQYHAELEGQEDYKKYISLLLFPPKHKAKNYEGTYCDDVDNRLTEAKKYIAGGYKKLI